MKKIFFVFALIAITIASCTKKAAPTTTVEPQPKMIDGATVFASNCARCHGADGIKDDRTPNLHTIALDKSGLVNSITHGKGHMPAFEDRLSVAEISAVADLIVGWHNK